MRARERERHGENDVDTRKERGSYKGMKREKKKEKQEQLCVRPKE